MLPCFGNFFSNLGEKIKLADECKPGAFRLRKRKY